MIFDTWDDGGERPRDEWGCHHIKGPGQDGTFTREMTLTLLNQLSEALMQNVPTNA